MRFLDSQQKFFRSNWRLPAVIANIWVWAAAVYCSFTEYPSVFNDFRNRVVGARLMKDGLDPYFYIWKKGCPLRYYDTGIDPAGPFSAMSATPFLHWIMSPICDLPQYQLCLLWFMLQWGCVLGCVWAAARLAPNPRRRQLVWLAGGALMLSVGFRQHFIQMQNYLLVPAFIMAAICLVWAKWLALDEADSTAFLKKLPVFTKQKLIVPVKALLNIRLLLAGSLLACTVLIRPTLLLMVAPLVLHRGGRKVLLHMGVVIVVYGAFAFVNTRQHYNWQQYFISMQYKTGAVPLPPYHPVAYEWAVHKTCEGVILTDTTTDQIFHDLYDGKSENSNYGIIHQKVFGHQTPHTLLFVLQLLSLVIGCGLSLWVIYKKMPLLAFHLLSIGFSMYWFFEFFSDVSAKTLYYFVMFLHMVLLYYALTPKIKWLPFVCISVGVLFNIVDVPFVRMHSTAGQVLILAGLLAGDWSPKKQ